MNTDTLKEIFQSPFNYPKYSREIVHSLFGCNDVLTQPELIDTSSLGDSSHYVGQMEDAEGRLLGFFYTRVAEGSDVRRKRVGLRKLIQPYLRYEVDAAIAVFDDGQHWRLSYICDHKEGTTSAKRFSYVLGDKAGQYKTPLERLDKIASKYGRFKLEDLKDAFSVDALSKEFFDEYHVHYDRIIAELSRQGNTGAVFHDYVKKMMGRIVFLHFLQKKGWLNNNPEFLRDLYFMSPYQADFLEQVLEPLFFGIFNTEPENREKVFRENGWDLDLLKQWNGSSTNELTHSHNNALPYLNGGLFERDEVDKMHIVLPASLFENLFEFMASYNFTVDENDPDDAEIGVDPEMLGKIFESLLEDNKAKGAFYTPKEIVRYMCKESLIAYLGTQVAGLSKEPEEQSTILSDYIRKFVEQHEFPEELEPYREVLGTALREVKICDPAIGSGAFPMGLLNELWRCREALEDYGSDKRPLLKGVLQSGGVCNDDEKGSSRFNLKKQIIENNIYGVDIEKGAIDIARLRFWLSIVVDAEKPEPLPNFDYKFMQGNSLIESFDGHDLSHIMDASSPLQRGAAKRRGMSKAGWAENQTGLDFSSEDTRHNLRIWLKRYFSLTDHKEKAYYRKLINSSVKNYIVQQGIGPAAETRLNSIDPSANQDFFLWHTWFKDIFENGGFDIVIGNPPYIQLQADGGKLGELYKDSGFYTFARTGDIYSLFYEQGWNILAKGGHLCYITSNKWMRAGYGEKTRDFFTTKTNHILLVDLGANVFENATVDTNILLYSKALNQRETMSVAFTGDSLENLSDFVQQQGTRCQFAGNDSWVILSAIEQSIKRKIEAVGTPLHDWDINIYRGVLTGYNEAFIIDTNKRDEILGNCKNEDERKRTAELIRPILRGRDIKRYGYDWANLWLINTHNGVRGRIPRIDINDYPAVKQHLDKHWDKICSRADKGDTPYNLRNCAYLDDFSKPKIIYPETTQGAYFAYDDKGLFVDKTCFMLISDDGQYLQQTLSSKLFAFAYKRIFSSVSLGEHGYQYNKHALIKLPIIKPPKRQLIDSSDIDHSIYNLYNISPEEISYIEQE